MSSAQDISGEERSAILSDSVLRDRLRTIGCQHPRNSERLMSLEILALRQRLTEAEQERDAYRSSAKLNLSLPDELWHQFAVKVKAQQMDVYADAFQAVDNILARNAQLAGEVEGLRKDAERYRWLRDESPKLPNRMPHVTQYPPAPFDGRAYDAMQIDRVGMDAAIDAALAREQGGGK